MAPQASKEGPWVRAATLAAVAAATLALASLMAQKRDGGLALRAAILREAVQPGADGGAAAAAAAAAATAAAAAAEEAATAAKQAGEASQRVADAVGAAALVQPAAAATAVQPGKPQAVAMLMIGRTGSSVLVDILNRHPAVLYMGERYNGIKSWQPGGLVEQYYAANYTGVYEYWLSRQPAEHREKVPTKDYAQLQFVGLKVNTWIAKFAPNATGKHWDTLKNVAPTKLICLHRHNDVKAVISENRAYALNGLCKTWNHVPGSNCSIPPDWEMSVPAFRNTLAQRIRQTQQHLEVCRYGASLFPTLYLSYEDVLERGLGWAARQLYTFLGLPEEGWAGTVARIEDGSEAVAFEKATPDDLRASLRNFDELVAAAKEVYAEVAANQFVGDDAADKPWRA